MRGICVGTGGAIRKPSWNTAFRYGKCSNADMVTSDSFLKDERISAASFSNLLGFRRRKFVVAVSIVDVLSDPARMMMDDVASSSGRVIPSSFAFKI